jgi:hypothetical protein
MLGFDLEPVQSGGRNHDRVQTALGQLPQPCVQVASEFLYLQVGPNGEKLRPAAKAARADLRSFGQSVQPTVRTRDQDIVRVFSLRHSANLKPRRELRREVLHAVHRQINLAGKQGILDFLREDALAAYPGQGKIAMNISLRGDGLDLQGKMRKSARKLSHDPVRLRQGKPAPA